MTSLNIGRVERKTAPQTATGACPNCGAGADRRIDGSGFGPAKLTLCGACGHQWEASK